MSGLRMNVSFIFGSANVRIGPIISSRCTSLSVRFRPVVRHTTCLFLPQSGLLDANRLYAAYFAFTARNLNDDAFVLSVKVIGVMDELWGA